MCDLQSVVFSMACLCMLLGVARPGAGQTQHSFRLESEEFPIGMYSVDSPGAMAQAESLGIDYVHTYGTGRDATEESIRRDLAYLDLAHKYGRSVLFQFQGKAFVNREDGVEAMLRVMGAVKDHPALGFWVFYDEPDGKHTPEQLMPFYKAAKEAVPEIPFAVCHCWSRHFQDYKEVADLNLHDCYPIRHKPFPASKINQMTRFTDRMLAVGLPAVPVNQCFNWQAIGRRNKAKVFRGSPVEELRYPTRAEIRYLCFGGLAQGVRGMFWWSYYWSVRSGYTWLDKEFAPVNREFRQFTRLVAPAHKGDIIESARDSDILMARWKRPTGEYLVAVNDWPLKRDLVRSMGGKVQDAELIPWGSTRKSEAAVRDGKLTVGSAEPWEVFVWRIKIPPRESEAVTVAK